MAPMRLVLAALVVPPTAPLRAPRITRRAFRLRSSTQSTLPPEESPRRTGRPCGPAAAPAKSQRQHKARPRRPRRVRVAGRRAREGLLRRASMHLQQLNIDARIEETLGDDDGWCRVGVDFQNDVLEAHRRGDALRVPQRRTGTTE